MQVTEHTNPPVSSYFFFEIQKEGGAEGDANAAAAKAVARAQEWIKVHDTNEDLPS